MTADRPDAHAPDVHNGPRQGSRLYLTGICAVASLGGFLFGFDTAVISGTIDFVQVLYGLRSLAVGWFTSSALLGCIVGAAIAGVLSDRWGRKPILILSGVLFFVSALGSAIPPDFQWLIVARMIGGVGVGMASVLAPMYISEFAPAAIRGRLVALYQLSIVIGILAAYFSNYLLLDIGRNHPEWVAFSKVFTWIVADQVWRGMFAVEMIPAAAFSLLLILVPESPRWLVYAGRPSRARSILARIDGSAAAEREMAEIRQSRGQVRGSFAELFRPGLRTALMVGVLLSVFGQLSGVNIVVYYGPKILAAAGFADIAALFGQVGLGVTNLVFTILALVFIDSLGRRPLLIGGMAVVTAALVVIGSLFLFGGAAPSLDAAAGAVPMSRALGVAIGVAIYVYMAAIAFSICAVIWVLTPEIFPNRVRGRAASIATFANWSTNAISAFAFPWFVGTFGMHAGFFTAAAICLTATLFFWRYVPETKGKSLEQIEQHWQAV